MSAGPRHGIDEPQQILVGHHVANVEGVRLTAVRNDRPARAEPLTVVAAKDDVDLLGGHTGVEAQHVPSRALRDDDDLARVAEHGGDVVTEVILLARVLLGVAQRQEIEDRRDLGHGRPEQPLGHEVQQQRRTRRPHAQAQSGLGPQQARHVADGAALGPGHRRRRQYADVGRRDEIGPRGEDDEALAQAGQRLDHAEGEDSEPGRPLADDRRVDRDRAWHWADYTVTLARGADRARPARARRRRVRSAPGLDPDRAPRAARGGPGRRAGFPALGATPPRRPRGR